MNEKIKKIAEMVNSDFTGVKNDLWSAEDIEKFAELIISECLEAASNTKEMFFNGRIATDCFTEKNRFAEGETVCDMVKNKIELKFGIK